MSAYELPWERTDASPIAVRIAAAEARRIVEGAHPPGALLTEAEIAKREGASRTPAREAMLQLEAWGLVRIAPKKGAVVTAVTPAERRDLMALRAMLERASAEAIARDAGGQRILAEGLEAELERQRAAVGDDDLLAFASADYAFHARIIQSLGNAVVDELCGTLAPRFARLTHAAASDRAEVLAGLLDDHEALARLLADGDAAGFAAALDAHLAAAHDPDRGAP
ncbi:GntR family transcriptional regulator [Gulosibacter sp. 10]|uniref:GntR family transcriptional regulator n=1 Tax=Gulosibacter sp. 10 TaxID=1255570 RepID=UPI00097EC611|nr:GntR family transcriptional regulator [Gulosibacter sp. 10]SJM68255.1 Transcriptional regulator, GntR family [Gulosibacter sp. 10]